MTIQQDDDIDNLESELASDPTGLAEIQKAMAEIEKLEKPAAEEVEIEQESEPAREKVKAQVKEKEKEPEQEESEDAEEEVIDVKTNKEPLPKKEDKFWKIKKDKYRALAEKEALMRENLELKNMLDQALNSGTYHYGKSAQLDLEKAKESKKRALENGDIEALIEADDAIIKARTILNDLEKWSYNDKTNKQPTYQAPVQQPKENYGYTPTLVEQEIANDWLESHSYLQPSSPDYNSKLANQVADYIESLNDYIEKTGKRDKYYSDEYFRTIDNYIGNIQSKSQKTAQHVESASHIGGVRNSYSAPTAGKRSSTSQVTLTADEKIMAANAGISEKEWAKYKLEQSKELQNRQIGR